MAYNDKLAGRVRIALAGERANEKQMMGGLCFMVRGHMCVGVTQDKLMVRTGPEGHAHALTLKHAVPMDFTGKPLKGFVFVLPAGMFDAARGGCVGEAGAGVHRDAAREGKVGWRGAPGKTPNTGANQVLTTGSG